MDSMTELFKARCTGGFLVVYDDRVALEMRTLMGTIKSNSLFYKNITGVEIQGVLMPIPFIWGGMGNLKVFSLGAQVIEAKLLKTPEAKKAKEMIEIKLSQ